MFDFSFGEIALVVLVALLVVGPKDLPKVMRALGRWAGQFKGIANEFREGFKSAMEQDETYKDIEKNIHDLHGEMQFIKDEQGNLQRVYDISDFLDEHERAKTMMKLNPEATAPEK